MNVCAHSRGKLDIEGGFGQRHQLMRATRIAIAAGVYTKRAAQSPRRRLIVTFTQARGENKRKPHLKLRTIQFSTFNRQNVLSVCARPGQTADSGHSWPRGDASWCARSVYMYMGMNHVCTISFAQNSPRSRIYINVSTRRNVVNSNKLLPVELLNPRDL